MQVTMDENTLTATGWRRTASGRYVHPDMPPLEGGRRRLFTEGEALTLAAGITITPPDPED